MSKKSKSKRVAGASGQPQDAEPSADGVDAPAPQPEDEGTAPREFSSYGMIHLKEELGWVAIRVVTRGDEVVRIEKLTDGDLKGLTADKIRRHMLLEIEGL